MLSPRRRQRLFASAGGVQRRLRLQENTQATAADIEAVAVNMTCCDTRDLWLAHFYAIGRSAGAPSAWGPSAWCDPQCDACTRQSPEGFRNRNWSSRSERRDGFSGLPELAGTAPQDLPHGCARRAVLLAGYPASADPDLFMCTPRGCRHVSSAGASNSSSIRGQWQAYLIVTVRAHTYRAPAHTIAKKYRTRVAMVHRPQS